MTAGTYFSHDLVMKHYPQKISSNINPYTTSDRYIINSNLKNEHATCYFATFPKFKPSVNYENAQGKKNDHWG